LLDFIFDLEVKVEERHPIGQANVLHTNECHPCLIPLFVCESSAELVEQTACDALRDFRGQGATASGARNIYATGIHMALFVVLAELSHIHLVGE
jgi:hypothetical protein